MNFNILLENFPDWAVPLSRVVPIFRTEDGYNLDELDFGFQFNYWFQKIDNLNYLLKIFVNASLEDQDDNTLPIFVDINLHILNERNYEFQQTNSV